MKVIISSFIISLAILNVSCSDKLKTSNNLDTKEVSDELNLISDSYEVADWKNFAEAAISHTWDDNTAKQLTVAVPIYNAYNFKATFFVTTDWVTDWNGMRNAAIKGHEIASHSISHASFAESTKTEITKELKGSQSKINSEITNQSCLTVAYPYCKNESYNLTNQYYIAARDCSGQVVPKTPNDFMNISSFSCGTESSAKTAEDFNAIAQKALLKNGWSVYLYHGIDNDGGYSPIESQELKEHLSFLENNKEVYWVDTFLNVIKYIKERDALSIKQTSKTNETITVDFTDNLDDSVYNYPITIKKEIPTSWTNVKLSQNNTTITYKIVVENEKKYIIFNIVPDQGTVTIAI